MPSSCKHCKVIDIFESQEQLVAIITFTDSACDVQLTDAVNAWSVQGCRLGNGGFPLHRYEPAEWLNRARDALCAATPSTSYKFRIKLLPSHNLQLRWTWQVEEGQHDTAWVELTPATPPGPSIRNMLLELAGSYSTVRTAVGELDGHLSTMQQQLATKDAALRTEIDQRLERERGLFLKFAELLNQKKSKLTELQQRVTDLEAEVEQLRIASQDAPDRDSDTPQPETDDPYAADTQDDEEEEEQQDEQGQQLLLKVEPGMLPAAAAAAAAAAAGGGSTQGVQPQLPVPAAAAAAAAVAVPKGGPGTQQEAVQQQQQGEQYDLMDAATQPIPDELLPRELLQHRQQKLLSKSEGLGAPPIAAHSSPAVVEDFTRQQQQQQRDEAMPQAAAVDDDPLGLAGLLPGGDAAPAPAAAETKIRKRTRR